MKKYLFLLTLICFCSCSSNSPLVEAGNPPSRPVKGTTRSLDDSCFADEIHFYNTVSKIVTTTVNATDCSFTADLVSDRLWGIQFLNDNNSIAVANFENTVDTISLYYYHDDGDLSDLDLGNFTLNGNIANPEHEPATLTDQDGDGISDFTDTDDDNDGILDSNEADCDSDGIIDDYDLNAACS